MTETRRTISRRTIAKGAAWSAPVIAVAASAPASATSGAPPEFTFLSACKSPGNSCKVFPKGYRFVFTVCNDDPLQSIWIYSVTYTDLVGTNLTLQHASPTLPYEVAAGGCSNITFQADSSSSANAVFTGTMLVSWGHESGGDPKNHPAIPVDFAVTGTSPDCACTALP